MQIANRKSGMRDGGGGRAAFTLLEILVACGVFAILGTALVGLMAAAIDAWNRGEASRQVNEEFQALRRQIADDLSAAALDLPPAPDFHYTLDTLLDLPSPSDPAYVVHSTSNAVLGPQAGILGHDLSYYEATSDSSDGVVILRIRVPFLVKAALLKARADVLDSESWIKLEVARNDPGADPPDIPPQDGDAAWFLVDYIEGEGIGGGETNITEALDYNNAHGDIVFIKATLHGAGAQFLRGDRLRPGGRPVLVLDCYRKEDTLSDRFRFTFAAYYKSGAQTVTFTRTLPPTLEPAAAQTSGAVARAQVVYRVDPYLSTAEKGGLTKIRRAFLRHDELPVPSVGSNQLRPNLIRLLDDMPNHPFPNAIVADEEFVTLTPNVLHLGMNFWGPETDTWEAHPEFEAGYDAKYDDSDPSKLRPRPPSQRWLSSRYLPEAVEVTTVLEPSRGERVTTALGRAIAADFPSAGADMLDVKSTQGFDNIRRPNASGKFARDPRHFIKVHTRVGNDWVGEWIFYDGIASPREFVLPHASVSRGMRGTLPAPHGVGSEVYRGVASVFSVAIPAFRSWKR